jgi:hypothetical protein
MTACPCWWPRVFEIRIVEGRNACDAGVAPLARGAIPDCSSRPLSPASGLALSGEGVEQAVAEERDGHDDRHQERR